MIRFLCYSCVLVQIIVSRKRQYNPVKRSIIPIPVRSKPVPKEVALTSFVSDLEPSPITTTPPAASVSPFSAPPTAKPWVFTTFFIHSIIIQTDPLHLFPKKSNVVADKGIIMYAYACKKSHQLHRYLHSAMATTKYIKKLSPSVCFVLSNHLSDQSSHCNQPRGPAETPRYSRYSLPDQWERRGQTLRQAVAHACTLQCVSTLQHQFRCRCSSVSLWRCSPQRDPRLVR